ncbi:MAG TPA: nucleotidyltransferase family protein, partial [Thermoleophilaceae bacterium]|nr:nucleotidyltransferase family protein [Thermoleophilaceae bacterium]
MAAGESAEHRDGLWARLDELVDGAPSVIDLLDHRLGAVAARHWRAQGRELPPAIVEEERYASAAELAARVLLARVARACDGPVVLLKGPEVAERYPEAAMRPSHDLDLLVEDSPGAFAALRAAGCVVLPSNEPAPQHEPPLAFPDLPLSIELHRAPKWPAWAASPPVAELLAEAMPSRVSADVLTPQPAHHAVLLAVHSWAHRPLARILDLADVSVMLREAGRPEAAAVARRWGVERVWDSTLRAIDALFAGHGEPWMLRTWARNTPRTRRPTRAEELLERCLSPFAALPAP